MKRESLVFAVSGTFFGLLVGWILGSQAPGSRAAATVVPVTQTSAATAPAPPPLDLQRAADLERRATANPTDAAVRTELGNVYFDGERYDLAIPWYEASLAISPADVNVSTDLAVCYFYVGQPDTALAQIDRSLAIDPNHVKTMFNRGIILLSGKSDLDGAAGAFRRVVELAPLSQEGQQAQELLGTLADQPVGAGSLGG